MRAVSYAYFVTCNVTFCTAKTQTLAVLTDRSAQVGLPYQYGLPEQAWQQKLMFANIALRALLAKALPPLFSPHMGIAVAAATPCEPTSQPHTLYQTELQKGEQTTRNICIACSLGIAVGFSRVAGMW